MGVRLKTFIIRNEINLFEWTKLPRKAPKIRHCGCTNICEDYPKGITRFRTYDKNNYCKTCGVTFPKDVHIKAANNNPLCICCHRRLRVTARQYRSERHKVLWKEQKQRYPELAITLPRHKGLEYDIIRNKEKINQSLLNQ